MNGHYFVLLNKDKEVISYGSGFINDEDRTRAVFIGSDVFNEVVNKFGTYRILYRNNSLEFEPIIEITKQQVEKEINGLITNKISEGFSCLETIFKASLIDQQNITTLYISRDLLPVLLYKDKYNNTRDLSTAEVVILFKAMSSHVQEHLKYLWDKKKTLSNLTTKEQIDELLEQVKQDYL